ncbi:pullulanase [Evansella vedderi]|uniref:Pullulanase n=1 Tax=Evansella vedderi TaxID=38282 RepID=A0ABT9ZYL0_9BACI|nr:type I pullulanase [Evansella vedderi]MDQ0255939.1 pullulanase [Evansella vedderi]
MKTHAAWLDDVHLIKVNFEGLLPSAIDTNDIKFKNNSGEIAIHGQLGEESDDGTLSIVIDKDLPLGEEIELMLGSITIPVYPRGVVRTQWFEEHYTAKDAALGIHYEPTGTLFTIWAPTATKVMLFLNNNKFSLNRQKYGIWNMFLEGDWHGAKYEYEITVNGRVNRVIDPYTKALLPNSEKGVIINPSSTNPPGWEQHRRPTVNNLQDSIIYELHVRDATVSESSGIVHKGKFIGLAEKGTVTSSGYSTGLSYMKELGVTHVQLLPINDFARVDELNPENHYNWGYDPLFYQVPEGSYSTNPEDRLSRMMECKQMIQALHEQDISVILDVVFNHVFIIEESAFEKIVPGYYFRYYEDGTLSNGTGVGNDVATERIMVRKFILDTVDYWLKEYKVDGFRFDLMGVMDVKTMKKINERCLKEEVPIMLLGEGWDLPTALHHEQKATSFQSHQLKGIRFFNDYFRDSIKGNNFDVYDQGFVNGKGRFIERLPQLVTGSALEEYGHVVVSDVTQTVNYVECHDNHTLWDRLIKSNETEGEEDRKKMHQLATGITILSQGVPFLHAGQEWFRTKHGDENSYISGDYINQLDWKQREQENKSIQFVKKLIALRKKYDVFRLVSKDEIRRRLHILVTPAPIFGWTLFGDREDFAIYVNPTKRRFQLQLPSTGKWSIIVSNAREGDTEISGEWMFINPYEFTVLKKSRN